MKVNTDGVLLGALAESENASTILDIGTGSGVIAMMLAQRFPKAHVTALEIDLQAAESAKKNFNDSTYSNRLKVKAQSFQDFSVQHTEHKYDLIVSNPPFFLNSLVNPNKKKEIARHTTQQFFKELVLFAAKHLNPDAACYLILPPEVAEYVVQRSSKHTLHLQRLINLRSSAQKAPHRQIIKLGFTKMATETQLLIIYDAEKVYTTQYRALLKDFLTIF